VGLACVAFVYEGRLCGASVGGGGRVYEGLVYESRVCCPRSPLVHTTFPFVHTVFAALQNGVFNTTNGREKIDENGQAGHATLTLQYLPNISYIIADQAKIILPVDMAYDADMDKTHTLFYPMPTWDQRDCMFSRAKRSQGDMCDRVNGECQPYGSCKCTDSTMISTGVGIFATCKPPKVEAIGLATLLGASGCVLVVILLLILYYRNTMKKNEMTAIRKQVSMQARIVRADKEIVDLTNTLKVVQEYNDNEKDIIEGLIATFRNDYKVTKTGGDDACSQEQVRKLRGGEKSASSTH